MAVEQLEEVAQALAGARSVVVLSGAGMSAESGVPTFRGAEGLWRNFRAEELATPDAFARDPAFVWEWYCWRRQRMAGVLPNPGHLAVARLEQRFARFTVVTQNIDGLHARAGSRRLLELHGSIWRDRCVGDRSHLFQRDPADWAGAAARRPRPLEHGPTERPAGVPRCHCGALLRPDVVWFGEMLDGAILQAATEAAGRADVALVVGTSSIVYPAAALPGIARRAGAVVVEIDPEETPLSAQADYVLRGPSGAVLPELERLIGS